MNYWSVFWTKGPKFGKGYRGVLNVNGTEDTLTADPHLGDKSHLAAYVRGAPIHGATATVGHS